MRLLPAMLLLVSGLVGTAGAPVQDADAPRWWRRLTDSTLVGLGTATSRSRDLAIEGARESALADLVRQRTIRVRSEQVVTARESMVAGVGTVVRGTEQIQSAEASASIGNLRERVATKRLSGHRWRAWVLVQ